MFSNTHFMLKPIVNMVIIIILIIIIITPPPVKLHPVGAHDLFRLFSVSFSLHKYAFPPKKVYFLEGQHWVAGHLRVLNKDRDLEQGTEAGGEGDGNFFKF